MSTIQEINTKLRAFNNTQKITKTMKMVSASKLRKAHQAQVKANLYAHTLTALTSRISASVDPRHHPLLLARRPVHKVLILVITSDQGLCGAFNHNANRRVAFWIQENRDRHQQIDISCCGKRGYLFFQKRESIKTYYDDVTENPQFADAMSIGQDLSRSFTTGEYDEIYLSYNQFFNPLSQKTVFEKILPIDADALIGERIKEKTEYIFEPEAAQLLVFLIPHFLDFKIYFALLENSAGEHGARMSAMDSAAKNASELIDRCTLWRNRARQAQITTELTEIIAGAETLK